MARSKTQSGTVVAAFEDPEDARKAIDELIDLGFTECQIGIVSHDNRYDLDRREGHESDVKDGAAAGAVAGFGIGALWGLAVLAGVIPGIGPAIAGGALGVLLSSAVAGAATVGIAGALLGLGISEEEAAYYEQEFHAGRTIVTVQAGPRSDCAWSVLARSKAYQL